MKNFYLPNYKDGSIVNLMGSIAGKFGVGSLYKQLKSLPAEKLRDSKNIVLLIIDGLGYNYLRKRKNSFLFKNLRGSMTSVFLPTTAAAITSFLTGVAPQQHAYTAWFMHLKEVGAVSEILFFSPRFGGDVFSKDKIEIEGILDKPGVMSKLKCSKFTIVPKFILDSDFTNLMARGSNKMAYEKFEGLLMQIKKAINSSERKKCIYAYYNGFDNSAHKNGVNSKKTEKCFKDLDKKLRNFVKNLKGTKTTLIITSDHGFVDTPINKNIMIENHPVFQECLTLPLCGEGRIPFCYVHPSKVKKFENYVKTKLRKYCYLFKSEELIKENYFGLFKPHPKLFDRVGDYILICKENYIIKDKIKKKEKKKKPHIGHHGGISSDEMLVPLIVFPR